MMIDPMKTCTSCGSKKTLDAFYLTRRKLEGPQGYMAVCKDCHKAKMRTNFESKAPDELETYYAAMRDRRILNLYGLTPEQYKELFDAQGGVCKLCGRPETARDSNDSSKVKSLAVDHDHLTGEVRGLLCMTCNTRVGYFEKYGLIDALLTYLRIGALA